MREVHFLKSMVNMLTPNPLSDQRLPFQTDTSCVKLENGRQALAFSFCSLALSNRIFEHS